MSGKKFLLPAIGAAVLVAGGTAAYLYFKGPAKGGMAPLAIAKVVPDDAYLATYFSSDLRAWAKLKEFGTPEAQQVFDKGLKEFEQQVLTKSNIDFEKDIRPWMGDAMMAVLPAEAGSETPNLLMVVTIRDKVSALNFAAKLASQSGGKGKESDYKGNKIFGSQDNSTYSTVLNDYLVIAPEQNAVQQAIDTAKGEPSLASKPGAEAILSKPVDVQNAIAHVYLLDYATAIQQIANSSPNATPLPPATMQQLKQVKSLVAGIGVEETGLRIKAFATVDPQAPKAEYKPTPGKVIAQFPADTLALVNGANINYYWSQVVKQAETNPDSQQAIDTMRQSAKSADFDLDKDIFGWMDGEFGIGLVPSDRGILAQTGFGGVMVIDTSDRKTAEATISKLDTLAKSSSNNSIAIQERDLQGKKITEWKTPYGAVLGHGWLDNDSIFVALGPLVDVVANKPNPSLDSSDPFKGMTGVLPKNNLGYFYVDMDKTMTLVNRFATMTQTPVPPEYTAVLNSIRGLAVTSTQPEPTTGQVDMLLALKKAK
ncbi:MAG: DUF3352 domain-containing protein [Leptolyngbyaceae cyanobacterium RU_5_1]|nr:DUF3352 domain-containing protein [Leptolyngbyaceae cyanobacterium RU_5_1]